MPLFGSCGVSNAADSNDRDQRQRAFTDGAKITYEPNVGLLINLLGAGAGGHDAVKPRHSSAGDSDK